MQSDWLKTVATYLFSKSSVKCIKLNDVGAKFILFSTSSHKVDIMRGKCVNLNFSICANVSNCRDKSATGCTARFPNVPYLHLP